MIGTPLAAVVDASVAVKWVVNETGSQAALRLRGSRLFAPDLLTAECANILWKKVARGDLLQADAEAAAAVLEAAPVELVPTRELLTAAVTLATTLGHPAYDCLYLLVSQQMGVPHGRPPACDGRQQLRRKGRRPLDLEACLRAAPA